MKSTDPNQFSEAISSSQRNHDPPNDLDSLVGCYNESLRSQLDMYAPVLTVTLMSGLLLRGSMKILGMPKA